MEAKYRHRHGDKGAAFWLYQAFAVASLPPVKYIFLFPLVVLSTYVFGVVPALVATVAIGVISFLDTAKTVKKHRATFLADRSDPWFPLLDSPVPSTAIRDVWLQNIFAYLWCSTIRAALSEVISGAIGGETGLDEGEDERGPPVRLVRLRVGEVAPVVSNVTMQTPPPPPEEDIVVQDVIPRAPILPQGIFGGISGPDRLRRDSMIDKTTTTRGSNNTHAESEPEPRGRSIRPLSKGPTSIMRPGAISPNLPGDAAKKAMRVIPPQVRHSLRHSVKREDRTVRRLGGPQKSVSDVIYNNFCRVTADVCYNGDFELEIILRVAGFRIPVLITDVRVKGRALLYLRTPEDLRDERLPLGLSLGFEKMPALDFNVKSEKFGFDVYQLPGVAEYLEKKLDEVIREHALWPHLVHIPFNDMANLDMPKWTPNYDDKDDYSVITEIGILAPDQERELGPEYSVVRVSCEKGMAADLRRDNWDKTSDMETFMGMRNEGEVHGRRDKERMYLYYKRETGPDALERAIVDVIFLYCRSDGDGEPYPIPPEYVPICTTYGGLCDANLASGGVIGSRSELDRERVYMSFRRRGQSSAQPISHVAICYPSIEEGADGEKVPQGYFRIPGSVNMYKSPTAASPFPVSLCIRKDGSLSVEDSYITDIALYFPTRNELVPDGYEIVHTADDFYLAEFPGPTPLEPMFLIYRRLPLSSISHLEAEARILTNCVLVDDAKLGRLKRSGFVSEHVSQMESTISSEYPAIFPGRSKSFFLDYEKIRTKTKVIQELRVSYHNSGAHLSDEWETWKLRGEHPLHLSVRRVGLKRAFDTLRGQTKSTTVESREEADLRTTLEAEERRLELERGQGGAHRGTRRPSFISSLTGSQWGDRAVSPAEKRGSPPDSAGSTHTTPELAATVPAGAPQGPGKLERGLEHIKGIRTKFPFSFGEEAPATAPAARVEKDESDDDREGKLFPDFNIFN